MSYLMYEAAQARIGDLHREAELRRRAALGTRRPRRSGGVRYALRSAVAAITALGILSAILVPSASAQPIDPPGVEIAPTPDAQSNVVAPREPEPRAASSGFDWGDAAVGAAGMLGALTLGAAGVATIRRTRRQSRPVLTS